MNQLFALYTLASLTHFAQNAEYIAFSPGLPVWMTRESVYFAWLAVAGGGGGLALIALRFRWQRLAAVLMVAYSLLGVTLECAAALRLKRLGVRKQAAVC